MKKLRSNIITLVIVSALVLFFVLKDDFDEIISVLLSANKLYIFFGILFILLGAKVTTFPVSTKQKSLFYTI